MRNLITALFLLLPLCGYAGVYKCTDAAGNVSFQEKACASTEISDEFTLKSVQVIHADNPLPTLTAADTANSNPKTDTGLNPNAPGGEIFCKKLVTQYKAEAKKVKAACKRGRNTYCDQSAEGIEQTQDRQFLRTASNSQVRNHSRNHASGSPLATMKEHMRLYNCS